MIAGASSDDIIKRSVLTLKTLPGNPRSILLYYIITAQSTCIIQSYINTVSNRLIYSRNSIFNTLLTKYGTQ